MFGKDKNKNKNVPVGAKEKIRRAKMIWEGRDPDQVESKGGGGGRGDETAISLVIIYGMSLVLALLLTQGPLGKGAPFVLPWGFLQRWLLGHPVPAVTGDADINTLVAVFVRGTAIFLGAGFVPLLAKIVSKLDRGEHETHPLLIIWFTSALLLALVYVLMTM